MKIDRKKYLKSFSKNSTPLILGAIKTKDKEKAIQKVLLEFANTVAHTSCLNDKQLKEFEKRVQKRLEKKGIEYVNPF